jgi:hypothetical protein
MKRRGASLDELWEEIKYNHEQRGVPVSRRWLKFWRTVHAIFCWKAESTRWLVGTIWDRREKGRCK